MGPIMAPQARRHYEKKYKTRAGEPNARGRTNQMNGAAAERAFQRANPSAKKTGPSSDFLMPDGTHVEVKYGTSGVLERQKRKGVKVVRYYRKGGKMVRISEAEAREIKNRQGRRR